MANKTISITKVRQILGYHHQGKATCSLRKLRSAIVINFILLDQNCSLPFNVAFPHLLDTG